MELGWALVDEPEEFGSSSRGLSCGRKSASVVVSSLEMQGRRTCSSGVSVRALGVLALVRVDNVVGNHRGDRRRAKSRSWGDGDSEKGRVEKDVGLREAGSSILDTRKQSRKST